jgi:hypothetical protein
MSFQLVVASARRSLQDDLQERSDAAGAHLLLVPSERADQSLCGSRVHTGGGVPAVGEVRGGSAWLP